MENELKRKALEEVLQVLNKHEEVISLLYDIDIRSKCEGHLNNLDLCELFDLDIPVTIHSKYIPMGNNRYLCFLDAKKRRIAWSDCGNQPTGWFYKIGFPTGPYIFSQEANYDVFHEFFRELIKYKPSYIDSANKSLYFDSEFAKYIHRDYDDIFKEYCEIERKASREFRKQKLLNQIKDLENEE